MEFTGVIVSHLEEGTLFSLFTFVSIHVFTSFSEDKFSQLSR